MSCNVHTIKHEMKQNHDLSTAHQCQKLDVILCPNTVIDPFAMMVEHINTSITFFTMEWIFTHASLAHMTEILVQMRVEIYFHLNCLLMHDLGCISRVDDRSQQPKNKYNHNHTTIRDNQNNLNNLILKIHINNYKLDEHQKCIDNGC